MCFRLFLLSHSILQVSVSCTLSDVKIDPLRGQINKDMDESHFATAARELCEESSMLFDLRHSEAIKNSISDSPRSDSGGGKVYHFRALFEGDAPVAPQVLINEYRTNRIVLNGCAEVLDLAVEPISRFSTSTKYPRLSQQSFEILSTIKTTSIGDMPSVTLRRQVIQCSKDHQIISYRDVLEADRGHRDLIHDDRAKKKYFPLLTDAAAWRYWIEMHDAERSSGSHRRCYVSALEVRFQFVHDGRSAAAQLYKKELDEARTKWGEDSKPVAPPLLHEVPLLPLLRAPSSGFIAPSQRFQTRRLSARSEPPPTACPASPIGAFCSAWRAPPQPRTRRRAARWRFARRDPVARCPPSRLRPVRGGPLVHLPLD